MTTGTLFALSNTATPANAGTVLSVTTSEAGASSAIQAINGGVANTGYAGYFSNSATTGWGIYAPGAAPNYFAGSVGIGDTSPLSKLSVNGDVVIPVGSTYYLGQAASYSGRLYSDSNQVILASSGSLPLRFDAPWATERMRITSAGNVGIGTTSPSQALDVNGQVHIATFASASATTVCQNAGVLSSCSSSIRYKEKVKDAIFGLPEVMKMRPVTFKWKGRDENDFGFIAEEMEHINPLFITHKDGRIEGVKYPELVAVLSKAIQEQQAEIDHLRQEIEIFKKAR